MALHLARRLLPGLVYAHVDADRLTNSMDAEERRRTRGPWTDGIVFGAAGHTAAGPRRWWMGLRVRGVRVESDDGGK